jgi:hypothetical protein
MPQQQQDDDDRYRYAEQPQQNGTHGCSSMTFTTAKRQHRLLRSRRMVKNSALSRNAVTNQHVCESPAAPPIVSAHWRLAASFHLVYERHVATWCRWLVGLLVTFAPKVTVRKPRVIDILLAIVSNK